MGDDVEHVMAEGSAGRGFDIEREAGGGDRGECGGGGARGEEDSRGAIQMFAEEFGGEALAGLGGLGEYGGGQRSTVNDRVSGEKK